MLSVSKGQLWFLCRALGSVCGHLNGASDELLLQSESVDVVVSQRVFSQSLSVNSFSHSFAVFLLLFAVAFGIWSCSLQLISCTKAASTVLIKLIIHQNSSQLTSSLLFLLLLLFSLHVGLTHLLHKNTNFPFVHQFLRLFRAFTCSWILFVFSSWKQLVLQSLSSKAKHREFLSTWSKNKKTLDTASLLMQAHTTSCWWISSDFTSPRLSSVSLELCQNTLTKYSS